MKKEWIKQNKINKLIQNKMKRYKETKNEKK